MIDYGSRRAWLGRFALCAMLSLSLAACGGGGGSESTANNAAPPDTPSVPPASPPSDNTPAPPANHAPVIDGDPAITVKAGDTYSFAPSASDADNEPLTFSITGKPAWLSFNTTTGVLSGKPASADVGQTEDIEITV